MLRGVRAMLGFRSRMHACSSYAFLAPSRAGPCALHVVPSQRAPTIRHNPLDISSAFRASFHRRSSTCVASAGVDADKPTQRENIQSASSQRLAQLLKLKLPSYCCGCGVKLQQEEPDGPGFFQVPRRLIDLAEEQAVLLGGASSAAADSSGDVEGGLSAEERERRSVDRAMEAWLDEQQRPAVPAAAVGEGQEVPEVSVKCARCYSLVHYGKVKSEAAEGLLPEFDLGRKVGRKIALQKDRQATVLCVVDVWDFDGSLPRAALTSLFPNAASPDAPLSQDPEALPFQLAVAVNKFDLLPTQATPKRVEQWVRTRLRQAGLPKPRRVFMVSALNGLGVSDMARTLKDDMGFRADLWVVGAQNAGKSSLINAMKKLGGTGGKGDPTVAPIPGTTLGLLRVPGIPLGPKHRTFDTPGVHHPYQLTSRLNMAETAAVLPRRRLKPRTYRIPAGTSILIGGLARVDVVSAPSATIYVTLYVSDEIVTHLGKTEGAEERREKHTGGLLVPPYDAERVQQLQLVPRTAVVEGDSWQQHARDIAIAGLGWISVGCEGTSELQVWAPDGVMVTMHDPLIPDYAKVFQKPGFSHLLPTRPGKGQKAPAGTGSSNGREAAAAAAAAEEGDLAVDMASSSSSSAGEDYESSSRARKQPKPDSSSSSRKSGRSSSYSSRSSSRSNRLPGGGERSSGNGSRQRRQRRVAS